MTNFPRRFAVRETALFALGLAVVASAMTSCVYTPPRSALVYAPSGGAPGWIPSGEGQSQTNQQTSLQTSLHGAPVTLGLSGATARIEVLVQNTTGQPLDFRMGGEGAAPDRGIGEFLLRPLRHEVGMPGGNYQPYRAMQTVRVEAGWRATFQLDVPAGREPSYGQFFDFTIEARLTSGAVERRTISLVAQGSPESDTGRKAFGVGR